MYSPTTTCARIGAHTCACAQRREVVQQRALDGTLSAAMAWRCGECGWRQLRAGQGSGRLRVWSTLVDAWRFHLSSSVRAIGALGTRRRFLDSDDCLGENGCCVCLLELFFGRPLPASHPGKSSSSVHPRTLQRASAPLLLSKGAGGDAGVARRLFACPRRPGRAPIDREP